MKVKITVEDVIMHILKHVLHSLEQKVSVIHVIASQTNADYYIQTHMLFHVNQNTPVCSINKTTHSPFAFNFVLPAQPAVSAIHCLPEIDEL